MNPDQTEPLWDVPDALVSLPPAMRLFDVRSKSAWYRRQAQGLVPKPVDLGGGLKRYRVRDLLECVRDPERWAQQNATQK